MENKQRKGGRKKRERIGNELKNEFRLKLENLVKFYGEQGKNHQLP